MSTLERLDCRSRQVGPVAEVDGDSVVVVAVDTEGDWLDDVTPDSSSAALVEASREQFHTNTFSRCDLLASKTRITCLRRGCILCALTSTLLARGVLDNLGSI